MPHPFTGPGSPVCPSPKETRYGTSIARTDFRSHVRMEPITGGSRYENRLHMRTYCIILFS